MGTQRLEKFLASGIYLLLGISAGYFFSVGLANGIVSGYRYPTQQKLLISAALIGATLMLLSAILVHFRPAAAYGFATVGTLLMWLAFWPFVVAFTLEVMIHRSLLSADCISLFALSLLSVATVISPLRLLKFTRN